MASTTVDQALAASISTVHPDIIRTQILTRLDGPTLASASCTSSQLRTLCSDEKLWREICTATWPSVKDSRCVQAISTFPAGHRSFFADSYPFVDSTSSPAADDGPMTTGLVSAVDLYYKGNLIFSKVQETKTTTEWFMSSPFRIDLLEPKESVPTRIQNPDQVYDAWSKHLEETLILNWVLIDPTRKRSANISSRIPVSAGQNWLTGEHQIRFATVIGSSTEAAVVVTCTAGEEEEIGAIRGGLHVREVKLQVEDTEGRSMNGRDSMVILQGMMEGKKNGEEGDGKGRYRGFVEKKRRLKETKEKRERAMDMACIVSALSIFVGFWSFLLFR